MSNPKKEFSKVYDKYIDRIYRFVFLKIGSSETAEDLTSEAFLRTWKVFEQGDSIDNHGAFLYQVARNLIADFYRKEGDVQIVSDENFQFPDPQENLEEKVKLRSDIGVVRQAIASLKEDYQNVIVWHYLDDLPIKEVAVLLGKSEGTTRVTIHRALKSLRKKIDKEDIHLS